MAYDFRCAPAPRRGESDLISSAGAQVETMTSNNMSQERFTGPLFIVGLPRSGTKLFRTLLNSHSKIRILTVETEFLPYWVKSWSSLGDLSQRPVFERFYNETLRLPYFVFQRQSGQCIHAGEWYESCQEFTPAGVFEALARHDAGVGLASDMIWGDKSPSYVRHLPLLKRLYPEARIIHIIRDVRDYCLSINNAWGKNMVRAAQRWSEEVATARAQGARLGDDYLELRYEDLLESPESELSRICGFLGREFEPAMCQLKEPVENLGAAVGKAEIVRGNKGKWSEKMSPRRLRRIEAIACTTLRSCGYAVSEDVEPRPVYRALMTFYKVLDGINLLRTNRACRLDIALRFYWNYHKITSI